MGRRGRADECLMACDCLEFFIHSIHTHRGRKLLGPGLLIVKGGGRVNETNAPHPHRGERTAGKMD